MNTTQRNSLALSLLERVTPLVLKYAKAYDLDLEDAKQDASIDILNVLDAGIERIENLPVYIALRVKSRIINKFNYTKRRQMQSLDAPITDDGNISLADLLPSPYRADPAAILLAQERLQELQTHLARPANYQTRRKLSELHATALASMEV